MTLSPALMQGLLGAISNPTGKPSRDEIEAALIQLAEAVAEIIKKMPGGTREKFEMQLEMALERNPALPGDDEE